MRKAPWLLIEPYRVESPVVHSVYGDDFGAFLIPYSTSGVTLRVVASAGDRDTRWEHVSVSLDRRCPTWAEMQYIKNVFWEDHETVMQYHVPTKEHVNIHPNCLHLWKPIGQKIPLPPKAAV